MIFGTTAAYAIYPIDACIDNIIENLNCAGCQDEDVCMLLAPSHRLAQVIDAKLGPRLTSSAPETSELRWLSRFGAVIVPGVAFLVSSRVFLRAALAPCPATQNSLYADRLMGLGLSQRDADRYGDRMQRDAILVFVCCSGEARAHWIREVLRSSGAEEAACLQEPVHPSVFDDQSRQLEIAS